MGSETHAPPAEVGTVSGNGAATAQLEAEKNRRALLKGIGVAAAGAVVGSVLSPERAEAHGTLHRDSNSAFPAIHGNNTFVGDGVIGTSTGGTGVRGVSDNDIGVDGSGANRGVDGSSNTGIGVAGSSDSSIGVEGFSVSNIGVQGRTRGIIGVNGSSPNGIGVAGFSENGIGVDGNGATSAWSATRKAERLCLRKLPTALLSTLSARPSSQPRGPGSFRLSRIRSS